MSKETKRKLTKNQKKLLEYLRKINKHETNNTQDS